MNDTAAPTVLASDETSVDPAALALRLADERATDIVEALDGQTPDTAAAVLLHLPQGLRMRSSELNQVV